MPKHHGQKNLIACVLLVLGLVVLVNGARAPITFGTVSGSVQHNFSTIDYWSSSSTSFSGVKAAISTSALQTHSFSCSSSFWIAVYCAAPAGSEGAEFIQVGFVDLFYTDSYLRTDSTAKSDLYAFWATSGSVDSVNFLAQKIQTVTNGDSHSYSLTFTGSSWEIRFDNRLIKTIGFKYPAQMVQLSHERNSVLPNDPISINAGVATFSNIYIMHLNSGVWTRWFNPEINYLMFAGTDDNRNGMSFDYLQNTVHMGWGQGDAPGSFTYPGSTPIYTNPTPTPNQKIEDVAPPGSEFHRVDSGSTGSTVGISNFLPGIIIIIAAIIILLI